MKHKTIPHHATNRWVIAILIDAKEIEVGFSDFLVERKYFWKQLMVSIDGKLLRGPVEEAQAGT